MDALRDKTTVLMDDLFEEARWPAYRAEIAAHTPIRSALALYLEFVGEALGALAFYDERPGWFTDERIHVAEVFADHATIALAKAAGHDHARQMEAALASNRVIGNAVGILMATYRLDRRQGTGRELLRRCQGESRRAEGRPRRAEGCEAGREACVGPSASGLDRRRAGTDRARGHAFADDAHLLRAGARSG